MIYDVRRNGFIRRVNKKVMDDEAMALDDGGRVLAYSEGHELVLKSIRLPPSAALIDNLRPRYQIAEAKLNPA